MKILFYHSTDSLNHHLGVLMDEAIKFSKEGHEVYFAICCKCLDICFANKESSKAKCIVCHYSTLHSLRKLQKYNVQILDLKDYSEITRLRHNYKYNNISDIKNIEYKNVKVGYSILSTYITLTRNNNPLFDSSFREYIDKLISSTCYLTDCLSNLIKILQPNLICLFNGRFFENRPVFDLAKALNIDVKCYEVIGGYGEDYYKVSFNNTMPHNIEENLIKINKIWDESSLTEEDKIKIGKSFYENRRYGKPACDVIYTKNQVTGVMPKGWDDSKRNIVIFNSSEDEFMAIGDEYDKLAFFNSQIEGLNIILDHFKNDEEIHFYLRVHPNLGKISYAYHKDLYRFEDKYSNITVIGANDEVSSYTLLDKAEKIIVFGSTIGLEASYWNKPVILVGAAIYHSLGICYKPNNLDGLFDLINNKNLLPKYNDVLIKFGFYYMYRNQNDKFKYIDFNHKSILMFGKLIELTNYQKLFGSRRLYSLVKISLVKFLKLFFSNKYSIPLKENND